jgi:hypothetical protein
MLYWICCQPQSLAWQERTCEAAAGGGQVHVLQWLRAQDPPCPWDERTIWAAVEAEEFAAIKWAAANGCPVPEGCLERLGQLTLYLMQNGMPL